MTKYQVVWRGGISYEVGGGIACGEYILALDRLGVDIKVEDTFPHHLPEDDKARSLRFRQLINKPYTTGKPRILVYHYPPYDIDIRKEKKRFKHILLNTVWETTRIPVQWFPLINQFDGVCVPSQHNITALQESGVNVPLFLVPHGADTQFFRPDNENLPLDVAEGKFVFVSVFDFQHRKNPEALLRAYWEEFSADEDVLLLIKTHYRGTNHGGRWIRESIYRYKRKLGIVGHTAPLVLITDTLDRRKLSGVYTRGNAFVLPTRGEGAGLPFIEALSSGIPVISTGWGGQMDFLNEGNSFLVDYKLEHPAARMYHAISPDYRILFSQPGQLWAEVDLASLRKQMRLAYQSPLLCKQKGKQGRKDMKTLTWDRGALAINRAVQNVLLKGGFYR
ncbi:glycosyltransferase [Ammoniphilus sp. YIM 78166]|uniref:glycosyltransferase n=1 Tax=Ammoniphilus sp. YIM 78166 TaxID=1644106 RepID=UPI0010703DA4|nr:glycosyltransferase [Ammoniphilus sp. YIM 78166]